MMDFKNVLTELGLDGLFDLVNSIVNSFKFLINLINSIGKVISLLLSPIADVLTAFLLPLLLVLKPIAIMVKQIMKPFMAIMLEASRSALAKKEAGDELGFLKNVYTGMQSVILGFEVVIVSILSYVQSFFLNSLVALLKPIFDILPFGLGDTLLSGILKINDYFKSVIGDVLIAQVGMLTKSINTININTYKDQAVDKIMSIFKPEEYSRKILQEEQDKQKQNIERSVYMATNVMSVKFNLGCNDMSMAATNKLNKYFDDSKKNMEELKQKLISKYSKSSGA